MEDVSNAAIQVCLVNDLYRIYKTMGLQPLVVQLYKSILTYSSLYYNLYKKEKKEEFFFNV